MSDWTGTAGEVAQTVVEQSRRCLAAYREDPNRVESDAVIEISTAEGGYGRKQIHELIQNAADALNGGSGEVQVLLTPECLYVANEGRPMTVDGVSALMASHLSRKRSDEIGRFGLGFKSVTAISDSPQILSRSGSFGFDRHAAAARIKEVVPSAPKTPLLRIAEPLDPEELAAADPHVRDLMRWATTVVRLPLKHDAVHVAEDMEKFPEQFMLFVPQVRRLRLSSVPTEHERDITLDRRPDGVLALSTGGATTTWRVLSKQHRPSAAALKDAGEISRRDVVELQWAVPTKAVGSLGQFWAFFPTESRTTLSGIVNAPWKVSDDRLNLLKGAFNEELLVEVLPTMLSRALPELVDQEDPAGFLDILPARGRGEIRSWADGTVNEPVFERLRAAPCVPDLTGTLRTPVDVRLHPKGLEQEWLDEWAAASDEHHRWVHHGVDRTLERRLKAERLLIAGDRGSESVREWIESLCTSGTVDASAAAVQLVARIVRERPALADEVTQARVLRLEDGSLVAPRPGTVFLRTTPDETGYSFIDERLAQVPVVVEALGSLGIKVLDRSGELRHALRSVATRAGADWSDVWRRSRQVPVELAEAIFRECVPHPVSRWLQVRTAAGRWRSVASAFLGGLVIPPDGRRDREHLIDPQYHQQDVELLTRLGAVSQPVLRHDAPDEEWLREYREVIGKAFARSATGSKPALDRLNVDGPRPPWPLQVLPDLSPEGRVVVTEQVLMVDGGASWTVRHSSNAGYGRKNYEGPVRWWLRRHGMLQTSCGPWPVTACLAPSDEWPSDVLPVPDVSERMAARLAIAQEPKELASEVWAALLRVATSWPDEVRRTSLYTWAVHFADKPTSIRVSDGTRAVDAPPDEVAVVGDALTYQSLLAQGSPTLHVEDEDDLEALVDRWGLVRGARLLQRELVVEPAGEPVALADAFPTLRNYLRSEHAHVELLTCTAISQITPTPKGQVVTSIPSLLHEGRVVLTATDPAEVLRQVSDVLDLGLQAADVRHVLDAQEQLKVRQLRIRIRAAADDDTRLAVAVGPDALRRAVPQLALQEAEESSGRSLTDRELAAMVRAVHGTGTLQHFQRVLEDQGLLPPVRWAGVTGARRFVTELGFPVEFAGMPSDRRPAVFEVEGPAVLGPLHDYQQTVLERIQRLLDGEGPARGIVSLPTGAGKTRVAVQAMVEAVRAGRLSGPLVWIAQSDELCEQAVQTWAYVWRALGPGDKLSISRFWGTNDVSEDPSSFQLVVATEDKLRGAVDHAVYAWITQAQVVVIDEAHTSISPTYTKILEWLGRQSRSRAERRPLIGLTATPFRNTNEKETERLVGRYDRHRLDDGAFDGDPYAVLQERGVLARVRQEELPGATVAFSASELAEMGRMGSLSVGTLPRSVETRLGEDRDRNRRILESIASLPEDWTALLFATSVENARVLAAQLTLRGVPSVAVSGDTDAAVRRQSIADFRAGRIRVITNYNVLSQGFDAPAVRAVYVTRPTFSTNLYQQMIGRGLRGPLNGGSEEVLIVNVRDNLQQYGDRLAFDDFDYLWNGR
ncbi:sacsin N-terminal ATP-binding-like domain-containing protein [Kineococcus terrestris]|uniref:sacsin N-terminal ATP-binding-like domain-containing protein n=1 Tax=Kineococcus terrestris TaxID=2044856 RepID=UPI0034DB5D54